MSLIQRYNPFPKRMLGSAAPMWLWVFAVFAVGAFVLLVTYLDWYQRETQTTETAKIQIMPQKNVGDSKSTDVSSKRSQPKNQGDKPTTQFDFYKLLPGLESVISEKQIAKSLSDKQPASLKKDPVTKDVITPANEVLVIPSSPGIRLYLQAGSFKQYQAADRMKANLAFIGLEATIHKVKIGQSGIWHRVRLGPYSTVQEMRRIKGRLNTKNIDSIMVQVKG